MEQRIPNLEAHLATLLERLAVKQGNQDLKGITATKTHKHWSWINKAFWLTLTAMIITELLQTSLSLPNAVTMLGFVSKFYNVVVVFTGCPLNQFLCLLTHMEYQPCTHQWCAVARAKRKTSSSCFRKGACLCKSTAKTLKYLGILCPPSSPR